MDFFFLSHFWILAVCLSSVVRGQVQVIGSSQPIRASVGDDVILPCHCDPEVNAEPLTVVWSHTELKPHSSDGLKRIPYVHIYQNHREDLAIKFPSYVNRTQMFLDQLRTGNISLRLHNLMLDDNGTYRCFVPNLRGSRSRDALISLIVDPVVDVVSPSPDPALVPKQRDLDLVVEPAIRGHWVIIAALILVLCLCAGAVAFVHFKDFMPKLPKQLSCVLCQTCQRDAPCDNRDSAVVKMETINLMMPSSETTASSPESMQRSTREAG